MLVRGYRLMSSAEVWKTWEGRVVDGKFPLRKWLGGSEHSAVFLTERQGPGSEKAAVKLIPADAGDADRQLARWRAAARLSHPHLIRIFDTGRCGQTLLYAVMEYAEEDLSQILPQRPLTSPEVADLLPPMLEALSYLHEKGFVHGRIRPSNVLAVGDQLKLTSDQIMSAGDTSSGRRRRDVYDAPETAGGIVSSASDLWSVGATLVAALQQSAPFSGEESQSDPGLPKTLPEPFRGIACECLRFDAKRRCSIADIVARLQPPGRSVPAEPEQPTVPSSHYRHSWRMLIPIAVLLAFGIGFVLFRRIFPQKASGHQEQIRIEDVRPSSQTQSPPPAPAPLPAPTAPVPKTAVPAKPPSQGQIVRQVLPEVSPGARHTIRGKIKVAVRVDVDASGKVAEAKLTSPGPSRYFASQTLKAAREWEFSAPEVAGQPEESAWSLVFRIGRKGTQVAPQRLKR
jgi:TonB family protein